MYQKTLTTFRTVLGIFLIIFGIAGMILPVLPGWWVALIGIELLGWKLVIDRHKPWTEMVRFKNIFLDKDKEEEEKK